MTDKNNYLLEVKDLKTSFFTSKGEVKAVNGVSFHVDRGEVVAIVGESGCGKSVTQMSIMQLVQSPPGKILSGEVLFEGKNLLEYKSNSREMRDIPQGSACRGVLPFQTGTGKRRDPGC